MQGWVSKGVSECVDQKRERYLVELEPDSPRDIFLGDINGSLESFSLRAKPETIVY